jgi:hypothetical protein
MPKYFSIPFIAGLSLIALGTASCGDSDRHRAEPHAQVDGAVTDGQVADDVPDADDLPDADLPDPDEDGEETDAGVDDAAASDASFRASDASSDDARRPFDPGSVVLSPPDGGWRNLHYLPELNTRMCPLGQSTPCLWSAGFASDSWTPSSGEAALRVSDPREAELQTSHLEGRYLYTCRNFQFTQRDLNSGEVLLERRCGAGLTVVGRQLIAGDAIIELDAEGGVASTHVIDVWASFHHRKGNLLYGFSESHLMSFQLVSGGQAQLIRSAFIRAIEHVAFGDNYAFVVAQDRETEFGVGWNLHVLSLQSDGDFVVLSKQPIVPPQALDASADTLRMLWSTNAEAILETFSVSSSGILTSLDRLVYAVPGGGYIPGDKAFDADRAYAHFTKLDAQAGLTTRALVVFDVRDPANLRASEITLPKKLHSLRTHDGRLLAVSSKESAASALRLSLFDLETSAALGSAELPAEYDVSAPPISSGSALVIPLRDSARQNACAQLQTAAAAVLHLDATTQSPLPLGYLQTSLTSAEWGLTQGAPYAIARLEPSEVSRFAAASQPFGVATPAKEWLREAQGVTLTLRSGLTLRSVERNGARLELRGKDADPSQPALSTLDLSTALAPSASCAKQVRVAGLEEAEAGVVTVQYLRFEQLTEGTYAERVGVGVVQLGADNQMRLRKATPATLEVKTNGWMNSGSWYTRGDGDGWTHALAGGAFVGLEYWDTKVEEAGYRLRVIDVRPDTPMSQVFVPLPNPLHPAHASDRSHGYSEPIVDGSLVLFSHAEAGNIPNQVRYWLDRVDISDPASPRLLPPLALPGVLSGRVSPTLLRTQEFELKQVLLPIPGCSSYAFGVTVDSPYLHVEPNGIYSLFYPCGVFQATTHEVELTSSGVMIRSSQVLPLMRK